MRVSHCENSGWRHTRKRHEPLPSTHVGKHTHTHSESGSVAHPWEWGTRLAAETVPKWKERRKFQRCVNRRERQTQLKRAHFQLYKYFRCLYHVPFLSHANKMEMTREMCETMQTHILLANESNTHGDACALCCFFLLLLLEICEVSLSLYLFRVISFEHVQANRRDNVVNNRIGAGERERHRSPFNVFTYANILVVLVVSSIEFPLSLECSVRFGRSFVRYFSKKRNRKTLRAVYSVCMLEWQRLCVDMR